MKITLTQFVNFINNYPHNFIEQAWADDGLLIKHFRHMYNRFAQDQVRRGTMASFLSELSENNRNKLAEWIDCRWPTENLVPDKYTVEIIVEESMYGVSITWEDRAVTVGSGAYVEGIDTTEIRFTRPAEGISLNHTVGHAIQEGQSITAVGLSSEALEALQIALELYHTTFTQTNKAS